MNSNYSFFGTPPSYSEPTLTDLVNGLASTTDESPEDNKAGTVIIENEPVICTYSGIAVPLRNPLPEHFNLCDIAYGLSRESRFNGQNDKVINVALHSIAVSRLVREIANERFGISSTNRRIRYIVLATAALLHDASEAYLKDLCRPLKVLLPAYQELQNKFTKAIFEAFDISHISEQDWKLIKHADEIALRTEQEQTFLRSATAQYWNWSDGVKYSDSYWKNYIGLTSEAQTDGSIRSLFCAEFNSIQKVQ